MYACVNVCAIVFPRKFHGLPSEGFRKAWVRYDELIGLFGQLAQLAGCKDVFCPISQGIPKPSKVHHIDSQALFDLVSAKYLYKSRAYSPFFITPTIPAICKQSAAIRWFWAT
jgi:hypothetical protein